jgi:hypothetical protein
MNVYKISDALEAKYKGSGTALAVSANGILIDICYFRDIFPEANDSIDNLKKLIDDVRLAPTIRYLSSLGKLHVGMCSSWEFVEL